MSSLDRQRTLTSVAVMLGLAGIIATHVMRSADRLDGRASRVPCTKPRSGSRVPRAVPTGPR